jgi:hypothetical protein
VVSPAVSLTKSVVSPLVKPVISPVSTSFKTASSTLSSVSEGVTSASNDLVGNIPIIGPTVNAINGVFRKLFYRSPKQQRSSPLEKEISEFLEEEESSSDEDIGELPFFERIRKTQERIRKQQLKAKRD